MRKKWQMQHSQNQSITQNQCAFMKSHHNYVFIQILHVWYLFSLLLSGKKIANFSKQSSRLVSLVIGAYWNPDLWNFLGDVGFELTSVDISGHQWTSVDGAKVSQTLPPPPQPLTEFLFSSWTVLWNFIFQSLNFWTLMLSEFSNQ